jgi:peptidoglycan hydrolase FlgJ
MTLNALDPRSFSDLQRLASADGSSPQALRAAAQQFEAMFMQMVFKAMRDATPADGLFDNEQTRMFQQLHDQQVALELSSRGSGTGLADVIFRQLGGEVMERAARGGAGTIGPDGRLYFDIADVPRRTAIAAARQEKIAAPVPETAAVEAQLPAAPVPPAPGSASERAQGFVRSIWDHAVSAGERLGVPPAFVVAQAALETGWGRAELRRADGVQSYNLFNIKAGSNWNGPVVELLATEYANGRVVTELAKFRAYGSYAEAFDDYVNLLRTSSRYAGVLGRSNAADFAGGLQQAGYATDPAYAEKLVRIIGGSTLRTALAG